MSIKILNKEFRSYDNLLGTPKNFLIGNVGDAYYCKLYVQYSVDKDYSLSSSLILSSETNQYGASYMKLINADAAQWNALGFSVGALVSFRYTQYVSNVGTNQLKVGYVVSIVGDEMVLDIAPLPNQVMPSVDNGSGDYIDDVRVYSVNAPEQLLASAFHVTNTNNRATSSHIDSTKPSVKFDSVDAMSVGQAIYGSLSGDQSGAALHGPFRLKYTGNTPRYKYYEIEFSNYILPYCSQDDFANGIAPDAFLGAECLTDRFIVEGRPDKNNPNIRTSTGVLESLGNTGWFNENFNGNLSAITASITYEDEAAGVPLSELNSAGNTKIQITVSGLTSFNGVHGLGFALIPNDLESIANKKQGGHELLNLMRANAYGVNTPVLPQAISGYGDLIMGYKDLDISQSGADLIINAVLVPSSALLTYLSTASSDDRKYIIWASCESGYMDIADSDKTSVLADYNTMQEYIAPVGAWGHQISVLNRFQATTEDESLCALDLKIEDAIMVKSNFMIGSVIPDNLIYKIVAYNSATGQQYELDKIEVNLSGFPLNGNELLINYTADRGYLTANNDLKTISIQRTPANDSGGDYAYTAIFPARIRYEDWINRLGAPADFYDAAEPQNGLNNDWYHYLSQAGWSIRIVLNTDAGANRYEDWRALSFNDYNQNTIISTSFEYYVQKSGTQLNGGTDPVAGGALGVIMEEDTRIEATFTRSSGSWTAPDLSSLYSVIRIEDAAGGGHISQHEILTGIDALSSSALQNLTGETGAKMELISATEIKVSCLVKPAKLAKADRYKITARLGCK